MSKQLVEKALCLCFDKLGNINTYMVESEIRRFMIDLKIDPDTREQIMKKLGAEMKPILEAVSETRSWLAAITE